MESIAFDIAKEIVREPSIRYPLWAISIGAIIFLLDKLVTLLNNIKNLKK